MRSALKQIRVEKALGKDNITPKVLKVDTETAVDLLQPMMQRY